ncbi:MAG: ABC transporter ATP-binding protein [Bdellovibrionales bacterium]|nr:ABC transporter ATP-binding protein [Bdellovibrionales bacterium]
MSWSGKWHDLRDVRAALWTYRRYVAVGLFSLALVDALELMPPLLLKEAADVVAAAVGSEKSGLGSSVSSDLTLSKLTRIAGLYLLVAILQGFCRYGWRMYLIRASHWAGRDLREKFAKHLFSLSPSFFDRSKIGDLMTLATQDVESVKVAIGHGVLVLADAFFYLVTVPFVMIHLAPGLTVWVLAPMLIMPWIVRKSETEIHRRFTQLQEAQSKLANIAQETFAGIRVVKSLSAESIRSRLFSEAGQEIQKKGLRLARIQAAFGPNLDFVLSLSLLVLLALGGYQVIQGAITIGTFIAFHRYLHKLSWPMTAVGLGLNYLKRAAVSSDRLDQVFLQKSDVENSSPASGAVSEMRVNRMDIEARNLCFRYPGSESVAGGRLALDHVSFKIPEKSKIALVGPLGSGKSTLMSLLVRSYPVNRGQLFIGGVDVNDWDLSQLREKISWVSQDVFLFSETVDWNLRLGLSLEASTQNASEAWIQEAARSAAVFDEIQGMPQGFESMLGERGVNLSGGQKQRITLGRGLVRLKERTSVLLLDDALSSVDVQTEKRIIDSVLKSENVPTLFIAAHRPSTFSFMDQILVFDQGRLVDQGSFQELSSRRSGVFKKILDEAKAKQALAELSQEDGGQDL